jgi:L-ascorbate metabolism protein UlaG (beta-lactamase superfamily)
MRLTKLGHSCVRLDKDGASLVIDPGIWSGQDPLAGANAVLITHEHVDHLDTSAVRAALDRDRGLELWTNAVVAEQFAGYGRRAHAIRRGDSFDAAGFEVHVHGRDHAAIHPDLLVVPNVCFAVDGNVFHPGDSFTVPDERVETLLLPISAPWLKAAEMFDYARAVRPRMSYAIHDEILNERGLELIGRLAAMLLGTPGDGGYARLAPGSGVEV